MKTGKTLLAGFSLLALGGAPAYADDLVKNQEAFDKLDKDSDGILGRIEAASDSDAGSRFEQLDANNDQKLTRAEYDARAQAGMQSTKASALIGNDVVDKRGEALGEIEDLVIDLEAGRVHAAVLDASGGRHYAFPIGEFERGRTGEELVLEVDKQKLEDAQGFAQNQWPAMDDDFWGRVGAQAAAGGTQRASMQLVRASELIGVNLQDRSGNDVGEVEEVMVNLDGGRVGGIVVDLNDGGRATIQANALERANGEDVVLDMSAEQLRSQAKG